MIYTRKRGTAVAKNGKIELVDMKRKIRTDSGCFFGHPMR